MPVTAWFRPINQIRCSLPLLCSLPHLHGKSKIASVGSVSRIPATEIEDVIVKSLQRASYRSKVMAVLQWDAGRGPQRVAGIRSHASMSRGSSGSGAEVGRRRRNILTRPTTASSLEFRGRSRHPGDPRRILLHGIPGTEAVRTRIEPVARACVSAIARGRRSPTRSCQVE